MFSRTNYTLFSEKMMRAYASNRVGHNDFNECVDPISKHPTVVALSRMQPPMASTEDVDYLLHELAHILERARPLKYIEIDNCFPISCQSLVAQFDDDPRSGVTHFAHTRKIRMCICCLAMLKDKLNKFALAYPELHALLCNA